MFHLAANHRFGRPAKMDQGFRLSARPISSTGFHRRSRLTMPAETEFHVLLSYNSVDREFVRQIKNELRSRELHTWFDEDQMGPGSIQGQLSPVLNTISAALILIGEHDQGPWQREEVKSLIARNLTKHLTKVLLIPVYLSEGLYDTHPPEAFLRDSLYFNVSQAADLMRQEPTAPIC
jgi:hypothetical protein